MQEVVAPTDNFKHTKSWARINALLPELRPPLPPSSQLLPPHDNQKNERSFHQLRTLFRTLKYVSICLNNTVLFELSEPGVVMPDGRHL